MKINYYTIHKNKRAKSLKKKRKARYVNVMPILISVIGQSQMYVLQSHPIPKYALSGESKESARAKKLLEIVEVAVNTAKGIAESIKKEPSQRFKIEGRYTTHKTKRK